MLLLYRNDGAGGFARHVIDRSAGVCSHLSAGDLDAQGGFDLLATNDNGEAYRSWLSGQ
jgi:hypothetical protein